MADPPTPARKVVDLRATRVVVEGPETEDPPRTVTYISCDLYLFFDSASNTAFFKLRFPLAPQDHLLVYLFIDPDQVSSLSLDRSTNKNAELAGLCGSSAPGTVCLRMSLRRPATIVGPKDCLPSSNVDASVLKHIEFLATQTALAVHIPQGDVSTANLQSLSTAASRGLLTRSASHANLGRVYGGRYGGGVVMKDLGSFTRNDDEPALPSYNDVAGPSRPSQGSTQEQPASKKRRRESSSPDAGADEKAAFVERSEHFRDQMRVLIRDVLEEDLAQKLEHVRKEVTAELGKMEARIMSSVTDQIDQLREEMTDRIDEAMAQAVSQDDLEEVVDDRAAGMKIEMEDYVKDEMRGVEEKMLDHFENGSWFGSFRRPDDI